MKTIILICLLSLGLKGQIDDKTLHFYSGFAVTVISAEIINQQIEKPFTSSAIGFGVGCLAGVAKEVVYDREMKRGVYSNTDMGMTIWGAACGALVIRVRFDLQEKKRKPIYKEYYE